jgi:hypothetical protein
MVIVCRPFHGLFFRGLIQALTRLATELPPASRARGRESGFVDFHFLSKDVDRASPARNHPVSVR